MFRAIATILFLVNLTHADEIVCSMPNKEVSDKIKQVISLHGKDPIKYEEALYELHSNTSKESTEAIVRLMSVYLGSWPGTANDCEIYKRGEQSLPYLDMMQYCLDSRMVPKGILTEHGPKWVQEQKQHLVSKIRNPKAGWCNFDA